MDLEEPWLAFLARERYQRTPLRVYVEVALKGRFSLVTSRGMASTSVHQRFGELYVVHAPQTVQFAYLLTGDKELAQDLVQEAFVKMLSRFQDLREPYSFQTYLRRTVINLSKKHWRRLAVERRHRSLQGALLSEAAVPFPDVATSDVLWDALQQLPARQRAAVILRFYEDFSEHQTGQVLGCSAGAVKLLVARAMKSLRASSIVEGSDGI
jgi:RNA polymerase sigma-70 factor (sigma-E family)